MPPNLDEIEFPSLFGTLDQTFICTSTIATSISEPSKPAFPYALGGDGGGGADTDESDESGDSEGEGEGEGGDGGGDGG